MLAALRQVIGKQSLALGRVARPIEARFQVTRLSARQVLYELRRGGRNGACAGK